MVKVKDDKDNPLDPEYETRLVKGIKLTRKPVDIYEPSFFDHQNSLANKVRAKSLELYSKNTTSLFQACCKLSDIDFDEEWSLFRRVFDPDLVNWSHVKDHPKLDRFIELILNLESYWGLAGRLNEDYKRRPKINKVINKLNAIRDELVDELGYKTEECFDMFWDLQSYIESDLLTPEHYYFNEDLIKLNFNAQLMLFISRQQKKENAGQLFSVKILSDCARKQLGSPNSKLISDIIMALFGTTYSEEEINDIYRRTG